MNETAFQKETETSKDDQGRLRNNSSKPRRLIKAKSNAMEQNPGKAADNDGFTEEDFKLQLISHKKIWQRLGKIPVSSWP